MKNRIASLILFFIMIIDLCTPVLAVSDTGQATKVNVEGGASETYTLTVPATLSLGETKDVVLSGRWPSNKTINITADTNIILVNNLDKDEYINTNIKFDSLKISGNNHDVVNISGKISVSTTEDVLFGTWTGTLRYYIESFESEIEGFPIPTLLPGDDWYQGSIGKDEITRIIFVDSYNGEDEIEEMWYADIDEGAEPDTQIRAYRIGTEIIIEGNGSGRIMANEDSSWMFGEDTSTGFRNLTDLVISILDTSNVKNMRGMFENCYSLKKLDLSGFNTHNVLNTTYMFSMCVNLTNIYVGQRWNMSKIVSSDKMFYNCIGLPNFSSSVIDKTNANTNESGYLTLKI